VILSKPGAGAEVRRLVRLEVEDTMTAMRSLARSRLWRVNIVKDVMVGDALVQIQEPADELAATNFDSWETWKDVTP
jgi:hypothetical protein